MEDKVHSQSTFTESNFEPDLRNVGVKYTSTYIIFAVKAKRKFSITLLFHSILKNVNVKDCKMNLKVAFHIFASWKWLKMMHLGFRISWFIVFNLSRNFSGSSTKHSLSMCILRSLWKTPPKVHVLALALVTLGDKAQLELQCITQGGQGKGSRCRYHDYLCQHWCWNCTLRSSHSKEPPEKVMSLLKWLKLLIFAILFLPFWISH